MKFSLVSRRRTSQVESINYPMAIDDLASLAQARDLQETIIIIIIIIIIGIIIIIILIAGIIIIIIKQRVACVCSLPHQRGPPRSH